jgi:type IV pilus assembly protein PilM
MNLPEFFSLDIGDHSIKVVEIRRDSKTKARLVHAGKVETPFGLLDNESDEGMQQLAQKIIEAKEAAGIKTKYCVAAVPESSIFSRLVTIPKVEPDKIEQSVHWEVRPMIPVPLENVDIAFLDIGEKEVAGQKLIDMYVVAAPKTLTDKFRTLAEKAGIELLALETEALATVRAVTFNRPETQGDIMVADLGANSTNLILARNGIVLFSQISTTGSDAFTKTIAADYGIDMAEAEKYKRAFGLLADKGEGKIAKSIEPIIQILAGDIVRTINYFREKVGGKLTNKIYLTGDGANLPGLVEYLQTKLNVEAELVNVFAGLEIDNTLKAQLADFSPGGMSVSVGLALKEAES